MRLLFLLGWIFVLFPGDISSTLHFPVSRNYERQGGNDYGISKTDKARRPLTFEEAGRQQHGDTDYGSQGDNDYARQGDNDYNKLIENFKGGCMTRCKKSELIKGIQSLLQSLKIKKSAIKEATDVACIEICKPN